MKKLLLLMVISIMTTAFGQEKIAVVSGNLGVLKGQTEVNVELKFDNVLLMKENITEAQYLENRKRDVLANPKKGEVEWQKWIAEWERYKKEEYVQSFAKGLNKSNKETAFKQAPSAKYTLVMDTKWLFPGWHGGLIIMTAQLSGSIKLVETTNPSVVLAEVELNKFDKFIQTKESVMEYGRIASVYESAGRYLGKEIRKSFK
ncbi:hypothetical protein [Chryseobacterium pennipullorum]|uniref:DUF4468 domain-containing protein n=1 Tax=Chryseobacterium pennipullorum TaxID=2258963 RepID=A0A3D9B3V1_9FLAO|nr:hypothetical protein [Chryseobacterium pennipullorum]REC48305.1 hypothetical protein DRF67_08200 [Chryseobacterium pennipullorum]